MTRFGNVGVEALELDLALDQEYARDGQRACVPAGLMRVNMTAGGEAETADVRVGACRGSTSPPNDILRRDPACEVCRNCEPVRPALGGERQNVVPGTIGAGGVAVSASGNVAVSMVTSPMIIGWSVVLATSGLRSSR